MEKNLLEGLIKVPLELEKNIQRVIEKHVFWKIRDDLTDIKKSFPKHWAFLRSEIKKRGIDLPSYKYPMPEDGLVLSIHNLKLDSLPKNYHHLQSDREDVRLVLDWYGKYASPDNATAKHTSIVKNGIRRSYIIILLSKTVLYKIPTGALPPEEIVHVLDEIFASVRHELQHLVQFALLQHVDQKQVEKLSDYSKHGKDYYGSPVEFEPQISDAIQDFLKTLTVLQDYGKKVDLKKAMRSYMSIVPSRLGDGFGTNTFFKSLRTHYPDRFKEASKKFYIGVMQKLKADLSESMSPFAQWKRWWGNINTNVLLDIPGGMDHDQYFFKNLNDFFEETLEDIYDEDGDIIDRDNALNKAYENGWQAILYDGSTKELMMRLDTNNTKSLRQFAELIAKQVQIDTIHIDKIHNDKIYSATVKDKDLEIFLKSGRIRSFNLNESSGDQYFEMNLSDVRDPRSRSTLVYMSPDDFLLLAEQGYDSSKEKNVARILKSNKKFTDLPFLLFVHDGKGNAFVVGHEGRHRARALKELGVDKMPVIIRSNESNKGKGIRWGIRNDKDSYDYIEKMPTKIYSEDKRASIPMPKSVIFPE